MEQKSSHWTRTRFQWTTAQSHTLEALVIGRQGIMRTMVHSEIQKEGPYDGIPVTNWSGTILSQYPNCPTWTSKTSKLRVE